MKKDRRIPDFKTEDEEREFWATHSPLDYFDTKDFKQIYIFLILELSEFCDPAVRYWPMPRRSVDLVTSTG